MKDGEPSRTAFAAARHRALHQVLDGGRIFADPLAWRILGFEPPTDPEELAALATERRGIRLFIAARHRIAEDVVAEAVDAGTRQVIVLGAGLDTFAYRSPHAGVAVFEVDHPATASWKAERLAAEGIDPGAARSVGVDFERDDLLERLAAAGFDASSPVAVMWLGVVPYLTPDAVEHTLRILGTLDAVVVFDYPEADSPDMDPALRQARARLSERVAAVGEPFLSSFAPDEVAALLRSAGFSRIDDLDAAGIARRLGADVAGSLPRGGGRILIART